MNKVEIEIEKEKSQSKSTSLRESFDFESQIDPKIDPENDLFPYSIVWTTLPCVSACFPCIGHTGIGDSTGRIHDFAGSEYVGIDDFSFGRPYKYVKLDPRNFDKKQFDKSIQQADQQFKTMQHSLCCNNCHSHVACVLNNVKYKNKNKFTMLDVCCMATFMSSYVDCNGFVKSYYGFLI